VSKRIVFTLAFGERRFGEMALGLGRSLRLIGDTTPRAVLTDIDDLPWEKSFDHVIRANVPKEDIWWSKFYALDHTDADEVLYIDGDCLAFKRLVPIFDYYQGAPFGVQGPVMSTGSWYDKSIAEVCASEGVSAVPKFNGGLMYYTRTPEMAEILAEAKRIALRAGEIGWRMSRGVPADEVCLSLAMARTGLGRAAPDVMNFTNSGVGLIGPLRMNVMRGECRYVCRRYSVQYAEPYVFHAHFYSKFLGYWRQVDKLRELEERDEWLGRRVVGSSGRN